MQNIETAVVNVLFLAEEGIETIEIHHFGIDCKCKLCKLKAKHEYQYIITGD